MSDNVDYKQRLLTVVATLLLPEYIDRLPSERQDVINEAFGDDFFNTVTLSLGHHGEFKEGQKLPEPSHGDFRNFFLKENVKEGFTRSIEMLVRFTRALSKRGPVPDEDTLSNFKDMVDQGCFGTCKCCGSSIDVILDFDTLSFKLDDSSEVCPMYGYTPEEIVFPVPSGRLIAANDLRKLLPEIKEHNEYEYFKKHSDGKIMAASIDSSLGLMINTKRHLEFGLLYLQTGNTGLTFFQTDDKVTIASIDPDEYDVSGLGEDKGYISTALWAVNMMDETLFKEKAAALGMTYEEALAQFEAFSIDLPGDEISIEDHYSFTGDSEAADIVYTINTAPSPKNAMR